MICSGPRRGSSPIQSFETRRLACLAMTVLLTAISLAGCAGNRSSNGGSMSEPSSDASSRSTDRSSTSSAPVEYPADLEASYVIGPTAARDLDCRITWQKRVQPTAGSGIKQLHVKDDSVYVLDGQNILTRLRREDGDRMWSLPVAGAHDQVFGMIYMPTVERLYVAVADALLVIDSGVGSLLDRQEFNRIANTAPVAFGSSILYGSLNGQLVWHSYAVGTQWRAYQVAESIRTTPVIEGNVVLVTGLDGVVMALNASSASQIWSKQLLDEIVAPPVAGNNAVFVAGVDQSLWAFDMGTGRGIWRYRTESPLRDGPSLVEDRVYQFVPGKGLVCLEAVPLDVPGGKVIWEAKDVTGRVICARRDALLVWDEGKRVLSVVSAARGNVIKSIALPDVRHLVCPSLEGGNLFAAGDDGRVIHLTWRN